MARIAGVDIPRDKKVFVSLTYIYGIGPTISQRVLERSNVNPEARVKELTEEEVNRIREIVDREYTVEGDLRREVNLNIKRLMEIGCYRGIRHRGPSGSWPADANQCADAEGPASRRLQDARRRPRRSKDKAPK